MTLLDLALGRPHPNRHGEPGSEGVDGVTIYWRDGCPFCARLRLAVRRYRDRARWVNIWEDPEAAAFVRSTNEGGDETVPTVVIDGVAHTNPPPSVVRDALARQPPPTAGSTGP